MGRGDTPSLSHSTLTTSCLALIYDNSRPLFPPNYGSATGIHLKVICQESKFSLFPHIDHPSTRPKCHIVQRFESYIIHTCRYLLKHNDIYASISDPYIAHKVEVEVVYDNLISAYNAMVYLQCSINKKTSCGVKVLNFVRPCNIDWVNGPLLFSS